jgi:hypothetical protein
MQPEPEPPTDRKAPIALWRFARMFFCNMHLAWGNPQDVAALPFLTSKIHELLASWIRVGEALMRHMLLLEAAALGAPAPSPAQQRRKPPRQRKLVEFYPEKPEDWRVSFACVAAMDRRRPRRPIPVHAGETPAVHNSFHTAWPLALRYEALVRAFNDPQAYARRLARHLHAHPELVEPLLRAPPEYKHRVDCAEEIMQAARAAYPRPSDSS